KCKVANFSSETNKTMINAGVRHEIDVFVKTLPDSPYEASVVFECKNWKKPVGKDQVVVLAEKVNALNASRGILVARSLTKHAKAQLELHGRLSWVECSDDFESPLNSLELFYAAYDLGARKTILCPRALPIA